MGKNNRITQSEKELLHAVGNHPDASLKELLNYTSYKWERTINRKIKQLREQPILYGPYHYLNYSKVCVNPLHRLYCVLELDLDQRYERVISYLKLIEPIKFVFPILTSHKKLLTGEFFSSNDAATANIFRTLKKNGIITDYRIRVYRSKLLFENPNLYADFNPSLDNLLEPCDISDISLDHHDTAWNTCDMSILPYMGRCPKLIHVLREEKKAHKKWTYEQIKYSREKMITHGLIRKGYVFDPFPPGQCVEFRLFFKTKEEELIPRILHNFARGERLLRVYAVFEELGGKNCRLGSINFTSHPLFLKDLSHNLDHTDQIREKEIYTMRSFPPDDTLSYSRPFVSKYFDVETQKLEYPYHIYEEKIKEKIECEAENESRSKP